MKKKFIVSLCALFTLCLLGLYKENIANAKEDVLPKVTLTANGDGQWCRCKKGGCYAGNNLSIRSCCAHSKSDPIKCTEYTGNCPPEGEE